MRLESMIGLKRGMVNLLPYQEDWPIVARETILELKGVFGGVAIDIEHIGSTAIPSIHAKPIIDIVIGVKALDDVFRFKDKLLSKGYAYRGEDVPGQHLFVKGDFENDTRTHHIHVVIWDGEEWKNYICFRDFLNAFPEKARQYDRCKLKAATMYPSDRKRYTAKKSRLVRCCIKEARVWKDNA